jgi:hypothetical protein
MYNYKPVSLLTYLQIIFEKVIYARLYQHLIDNNTLVKGRFGFKGNSSTAKVMYKLLNEILNVIKIKLMVGAYFAIWKNF